MMDPQKAEAKECAHCGFTAPSKFQEDVCPQCNLTSWRCNNCGYTLTGANPPEVCPGCNQNCLFVNITCYTPECGGPGGIDPRL